MPVNVFSLADELDTMHTLRRSAETLEGELIAGCRSHEAVVSSRTTAGAAVCLPSLNEVMRGEHREKGKFSDALNAGVTANWSSAGEQWELRLFAPGLGSPPDVISKPGQPHRQLECNFSGDLPGMGLDLSATRTLRRARGWDFQFSDGQAESELRSAVVLPPHFIRPV